VTTEVGDRGLVFSAGSDWSTYVTVAKPVVGEKVILYNLGSSGQQLAVPVLAFSLTDFTFTVPSFQFAGFDWKFNWDLFLANFKKDDFFWRFNLHNITFIDDYGVTYGDDADPFHVRITIGGVHGGDATIAMETTYTGHYDTILEIKILTSTTFEWWFDWETFENHHGRWDYKGAMMAYLPGRVETETAHGTATI